MGQTGHGSRRSGRGIPPAELGPIELAPIQRKALREANLPVVIIDPMNETVVDANQAIADLVDIEDPASMVGRVVDDVLPTDEQGQAHRRKSLSLIADGSIDGYFGTRPALLARGPTTLHVWARRLPDVVRPCVLAGGIAAVPGASDESPRDARTRHRGRFCILMTDHDWIVTDASLELSDVIGLDDDEVRGQPILGLVHPRDAGDLIDAVTSSPLGLTVASVGVQFRGVGGTWRRLAITPLAMCDHTPPRLCCVISPADTPRLDADSPDISTLADQARATSVLASLSPFCAQRVKLAGLSAHESEMLFRLLDGESAKVIATAMHISRGTARNQISRLYRKFGVHSQVELLATLR